MSAIRFEASTDGDEITLQIFGLDANVSYSAEDLRHHFSLSPFHHYQLDDVSLQQACQLYRQLQQQSSKTESAPAQDTAVVSMVVAKKLDAEVMVEVSPDRMLCHLRIMTAQGGKNPDAAELQSHLQQASVVRGIRENIVLALAAKLENIAPGTEIREMVAEGKSAGETRGVRLEYQVQPVQDRLLKPVLRDNGTVDMYDFGEIEMVSPGDVLVERFPAVTGEPGYTVTGDVLEAEKAREITLQAGDGTAISPDNQNLLVATRKGVAMRIDNGMEVADAYCVRDVDLKTGNIHFDGTVMVQGSVKVGMSIKAGGDVVVRDYLESASIESGGNVIIGKGIIGHQVGVAHDGHENSASVVCAGDLDLNYAQHADIVAGNQVRVAKHLLHCNVQARDIIVLSPKKNEGRIIGGIMRPGHLLDCNVLGSPSYGHILVDFSWAVATELAELEGLNEQLGERVRVMRGMLAALRQFEVKSGSPELEEQAQKIRNTIQHFETLVAELKQRRKALLQNIENVRQGFEVRVERNLYPGVSVRFIKQENPVRDERGGCRLKAKPTTDILGYFNL